MIEDAEKKLNHMLDLLNCEVLSKPVVDKLYEISRGRSQRILPFVI